MLHVDAKQENVYTRQVSYVEPRTTEKIFLLTRALANKTRAIDLLTRLDLPQRRSHNETRLLWSPRRLARIHRSSVYVGGMTVHDERRLVRTI